MNLLLYSPEDFDVHPEFFNNSVFCSHNSPNLSLINKSILRQVVIVYSFMFQSFTHCYLQI